VFRFLVLSIAAIFGSKALLIAENLCLRQQLLVLQRSHPRTRLSNADRRFWILASRASRLPSNVCSLVPHDASAEMIASILPSPLGRKPRTALPRQDRGLHRECSVTKQRLRDQHRGPCQREFHTPV
jgi:hypothetical protein